MALPTDPASSREEILARRRASEEEALLREVDDAVRQDDLVSFTQTYGRQLAFGVGTILLVFGGYLFWQSRQEAGLERQAEVLVSAIDQAQAGNLSAAATTASPIASDGADGPSASARFLTAGAQMAQNRSDEAARILATLAVDNAAPQELRELARIRAVAIRYDAMDKAAIVRDLGPLAKPGSAWFGSAGELVAMAYLDQGKRAEAGQLFAQIAATPTVPDAIRSRARQMAGILGVDAIQDAGRFIQQQERTQQSGAGAPAAPAA